MVIEVSQKEDKNKIRALYEAAFKDNQAFVDYYFEEKYQPDRIMVIKEEEHMVSMAHLNPYEVVWKGKNYSAAYIVAVATDEAYRNKGYMGRLIKAALNKLYADGEAFSLLMPIDSRIYERYGFGFTQDILVMTCQTGTFTIQPIPYVYQKVSEKNFVRLVELYQAYAKQLDLGTVRNICYFEKLYKELQTDQAEVILFDGGYLITFMNEDILHVREIVALSEKCLTEMLTYLQDKTHRGRVVIYDHNQSRIKHVIPNIPGNKIELKPFMMTRIIHAQKFLQLNLELFEKDIAIKIIDEDIEANNQTYQIDHQGVCVRQDDYYDVKLNIKTLTQLAFSYIKEEDIVYMNAINEHFKDRPIIRKGKANILFFNEYV